MNYDYRNAKVEKLCKNFGHAQKVLGTEGAKRLKRRLEDLDAAERIGDLVAGHPHPLTGDRLGQFAITVTGALRLLLTPSIEPVPEKADKSVDWAAVTAVLILDIEDYHD